MDLFDGLAIGGHQRGKAISLWDFPPNSTYEDGAVRLWCFDKKHMPDAIRRAANFAEWPNDASMVSLYDVLETSVPSRFSLSSKACGSMLRRAKNRGKNLPEPLRRALEAVAART